MNQRQVNMVLLITLFIVVQKIQILPTRLPLWLLHVTKWVLNIQLTEEPSFPINKITGVQQMTHIKLFQLPSDFVQTSKLAISVKKLSSCVFPYHHHLIKLLCAVHQTWFNRNRMYCSLKKVWGIVFNNLNKTV